MERDRFLDQTGARVPDGPGGQLVAALQGHTAVVRGVALSGDGRLVASGGDDEMVSRT